MKPRVFIMGYPGTGQAGTPDDLNAEKSYSAFPVHMNTVAGNEVLVLDAATRHPSASVFGLNPGLIKTNIRDAPELEGHSGALFDRKGRRRCCRGRPLTGLDA